MIEIRRILCPVDFSDHSRRALDHAIAIARWYKSTVTVLHVFSVAPVAAAGPGAAIFEPIVLTPVERDQLVADVRAFAKAESAAGITIDAVLREGNAAAEVLEYATCMKPIYWLSVHMDDPDSSACFSDRSPRRSSGRPAARS